MTLIPPRAAGRGPADRRGRAAADHRTAGAAGQDHRGDADPAGPAGADDRGLVLPGPLRSGGPRRPARDAGLGAPAHRSADGELAAGGRRRAPGQPGLAGPGPARRAQPDDRRPRHRAQRDLAARPPVAAARCTAVGGAARRCSRHGARLHRVPRAPRSVRRPDRRRTRHRAAGRAERGPIPGRRCTPRWAAPTSSSSRAGPPPWTWTRPGSTASSWSRARWSPTTRRWSWTSCSTSGLAGPGWRCAAIRAPGCCMLGGEPFAEEIVMWWNFIGRSHDEVVGYREAWATRDPRFPPVVDRDEKVMEAPPLPSVTLKPRPHRVERP